MKKKQKRQNIPHRTIKCGEWAFWRFVVMRSTLWRELHIWGGVICHIKRLLCLQCSTKVAYFPTACLIFCVIFW